MDTAVIGLIESDTDTPVILGGGGRHGKSRSDPKVDRRIESRRAAIREPTPIPASSGNTHATADRGGDRQLNRALHIIALSRAPTDPATRAYPDRRHSEGKTKREAIRCLKRHLARRIWRLLYTTTPIPQPHGHDPPTPSPSALQRSRHAPAETRK
jgi:hypothetical protein